MTLGWKNQFQKGTYVFMNIHSMICVLTLAHRAWISYTSLQITHLSTGTSVTFLTSPDVITTASDEDIPNLEDVLQL